MSQYSLSTLSNLLCAQITHASHFHHVDLLSPWGQLSPASVPSSPWLHHLLSRAFPRPGPSCPACTWLFACQRKEATRGSRPCRLLTFDRFLYMRPPPEFAPVKKCSSVFLFNKKHHLFFFFNYYY
uniref:Uncharacterized protein n=1 Tax=Pipistrellus kuhlii TaxID=59472 RepID=A0A7J7YNN0_PIPKU|nr:hypothetical protein mPipKuh1_010107 [Pipistrellus kuhlii]